MAASVDEAEERFVPAKHRGLLSGHHGANLVQGQGLPKSLNFELAENCSCILPSRVSREQLKYHTPQEKFWLA